MQCETVAGGLHGNRLMFATAYKMWTKEGLRSFYRGLGPGLIGMAPYAAIDLGTFEYVKNHITDRNIEQGLHEEDARPSAVMTAVVGGCTGSLGATVVYPVNLLRTRLQTQGTILHPRTYKGFWDVAKITIEGEGYRGLFKGLLPNLFKVVPAVSIVSISICCSDQY
jgi:solute carrier family 25 phosphate transporter 23/24/25/41